jgi:hypothetical protein
MKTGSWYLPQTTCADAAHAAKTAAAIVPMDFKNLNEVELELPRSSKLLSKAA